MGAGDFIPSGAIRLQLRSRTKEEVIRELVSLLESDAKLRKEMYERLMRHEQLGSTGIGGGIAIPYYRFKALSRPRLAFGRAPQGIDFKAIDGDPVYYFFMLLGPTLPDRKEGVTERLRQRGAPEEFLRLMWNLVTWFRKAGVTERLRQLESPEDSLRLLEDEGI